MQYKVKSWLREFGPQGLDGYNGELGPFSDRTTAERALVSLCQAGKATSGEIIEVESYEDEDSAGSAGDAA
jgi:hypothetical protein